ncbi:diguanylate cyclase [Solibacillus sp. FSL R7-0682]|uniref:sensor domain-containing diguanylate cyclase n=1 Tax=Solibacillus sp. FSL R7-0682 TaxID=2921690 RepID=UPI0030F99955
MDSKFSVEQLELLFGKSRDAVFFMEKIEDDYRYNFLNDTAIKLINMNPIGQTLLQVIPPHTSKNIFHYYQISDEQQDQVEFEDYTYSKFEIRKQKTTVIPVQTEGKSFLLAITREIPVGRDLEDKYLFMRSVFYKSFLSTILISTEFQLLEANQKFVDEFNIRLEDSHSNFFELPFIDQECVPMLKEYINQAQNGENITSKMLYFIDKNHVRRYYTATFSSLTSNDKTIAVFIILQEITAFVEQKQALRTASHGLETLKNAISSAADVIFTNTDGIIIDVNERVIQNTGYAREELVGKTHRVFNSGYHTKQFFDRLWKTIKSGNIWRDEICNRKKNGETYWMDATTIPIIDENGEIEQYITIQYNISSKKELMSELYKIESNFRAITENTNDFILIADKDGKIKYASPSYIRKLGYSEEELIGQTYENLLTIDSLAVWQKELSIIKRNGILENKIELQLLSKNHHTMWTEGNYTITLDMAQQKIEEIVMVSREITERKQLEDKLTYLAYHDSLTQLGNRRLLYRDFPEILNKAIINNESIAIFYIDGDNFKQVNDLYGHDVGDEFLKEFGQALVKCIRNDDLIVRLGGDEFLIALTGLSSNEQVRLEQIKHIVERIRLQLKIGWTIRDLHFAPTTSIGISIYPEHSDTLEQLIDLADRALYQAKQISKNNYCISSVQLNV